MDLAQIMSLWSLSILMDLGHIIDIVVYHTGSGTEYKHCLS